MDNYNPNIITIPAKELRAGDYIETTYENGKRGGWAGISYVTHTNTTTTAHGMMTSYDYTNNTLITVERG